MPRRNPIVRTLARLLRPAVEEILRERAPDSARRADALPDYARLRDGALVIDLNRAEADQVDLVGSSGLIVRPKFGRRHPVPRGWEVRRP